MATYTINDMKKIISKLKNIGIGKEKEILNLKVMDLYKIKEKSKISIKDLEIIWQIQFMILNNSWLEILFDSGKNEEVQDGKSN